MMATPSIPPFRGKSQGKVRKIAEWTFSGTIVAAICSGNLIGEKQMANRTVRGRHILVVEDEYFLAMEMKGRLQQAGAIVVGPVASTGDAYDLLRKERVDAALLDIELRAETSYPIAERLLVIGIPFLFVSNASNVAPAYRHRCFDKATSLETITRALFPDDC